MRDSTDAGHITLRARKPFLYRGHSIMPGDVLTVPWHEGQRLKTARCLEHLLAKNINAKLWGSYRRGVEMRFDDEPVGRGQPA